jgi:pimeloyl-ACP methyl ester carboxylesterase
LAELQFLMASGPDGPRIAYLSRPSLARSGEGPTFVWLGGFHSDMTGSKATIVDAFAAEYGYGSVRFDYFGHGASDGAFEDGTISQWKADALAVIDQLTTGPLVLVGSSMGGWLALLAALVRPERVKALCLIAPAPDFTEDLMWSQFAPDVRHQINATGRWMRPSAYGEDPYPITRALIEDGRSHLLLGAPIPFEGRVHIVHGQQDADVPWQRSLDLAQKLTSRTVITTFVKSGDHRLSTSEDLEVLHSALVNLAGPFL